MSLHRMHIFFRDDPANILKNVNSEEEIRCVFDEFDDNCER